MTTRLLTLAAFALLLPGGARAGLVPLRTTLPSFNAPQCVEDSTSALTDLAFLRVQVTKFGRPDTITADVPVAGREGQAFDLPDITVLDGSMGTVLVRAFDANGNGSCHVASYLYAVPAIAAPEGPPPGAGLWAEYYLGTEPSGTPAFTVADSTVDFNWGSAFAWPGGPVDNFAARWSGTITLPASGTWAFYLTSDDGRRLWIDGALVIDFWVPTWSEGSWAGTLSSGTHSITVEYFEAGGGALCILSWMPPGGSRSVVPAAALSH